MALEDQFRAFLAASTRVTAHVGSSNAARIEPSVLPEGVGYPAIRYQRISTVRELTQDGPTGMPQVRMQVDCFAEDGTVYDLAEGVRKTLDGFVGTMGTVGVGVAMNADEDAFWEEEVEVYRVRQDYMIHHREATT